MPDPKKTPESNESKVRFTSGPDLLEIREEDTEPGKVSPRYRKWLEEKYGRKHKSAEGPTDGAAP